jgi:AcrR family transcriptional regulator
VIVTDSTSTQPHRDPDATRTAILAAAFAEFFRHGYQGGSLSRIVEGAGVTKGALFHHFPAGKLALGYAVVDEITGPLLFARWLDPVVGAADPLAVMQDLFRRFIQVDIGTGSWINGCPLNNVAQEMSPLDEGFRTRAESLYASWRATYATALRDAASRGVVRRDVDPDEAAALIVATQMGIWGTGKYSRDAALMTQAGEALCAYLETLRPAPTRT